MTPSTIVTQADPGDTQEYRFHIGPADFYDLQSALQFNLLTALGLRDTHRLLDIGCGSLRAGRLFITYLRSGNYYGIEPLAWLIEDGIQREIGASMIALKQPHFSHDDDFTLTTFGETFDFMIAQSIFSHASQAQIRRCIAQARLSLKPDGVLAATFFEGPINYEGSQWVAKADYTMAHMRSMVEGEGMAFTPITWAHPDPQQWFLVHHPGTMPALAKPTDAQQVAVLEERLALVQQQFLAIKTHPYVRFGLRIKFFLMWLGFERRRLARLWRGLRGG